MLLIGGVKIVNNKGPRTGLCGTPGVQNMVSDRAVPMPNAHLLITVTQVRRVQGYQKLSPPDDSHLGAFNSKGFLF